MFLIDTLWPQRADQLVHLAHADAFVAALANEPLPAPSRAAWGGDDTRALVACCRGLSLARAPQASAPTIADSTGCISPLHLGGWGRPCYSASRWAASAEACRCKAVKGSSQWPSGVTPVAGGPAGGELPRVDRRPGIPSPGGDVRGPASGLLSVARTRLSMVCLASLLGTGIQ